MDIFEFLKNKNKYPVFFMGSGISKRYLDNYPNWKELILKVYELIGKGVDDYNTDKNLIEIEKGSLNESQILPILASKLNLLYESIAKNLVKKDNIHEAVMKIFKDGENHNSKLKILISEILSRNTIIEDDLLKKELNEFKLLYKNIYTFVTTNYDTLIEDLLMGNVDVVIGNEIHFTEPCNSIYKIHGSVTSPNSIIIDERDYQMFENDNILIKSQLVSLFLHHPIIFIGYRIGDKNIHTLLSNIFKDIDPKSKLGLNLSNNFLLIQRDINNNTLEIEDHDIELADNQFIKIKKIKTDNYLKLFKTLNQMKFPVPVDSLKVFKNSMNYIEYDPLNAPSLVMSDDIANIDPSKRVVSIGPTSRFYRISRTKQFMHDYINNENFESISFNTFISEIDDFPIQSTQYFPMKRILKLCSPEVIESKKEKVDKLILSQNTKISAYIKSIKECNKELRLKYFSDSQQEHDIINVIERLKENNVKTTAVKQILCLMVYDKNISELSLLSYLKDPELDTTDYNRLVTLYDYSYFNIDSQ